MDFEGIKIHSIGFKIPAVTRLEGLDFFVISSGFSIYLKPFNSLKNQDSLPKTSQIKIL